MDANRPEALISDGNCIAKMHFFVFDILRNLEACNACIVRLCLNFRYSIYTSTLFIISQVAALRPHMYLKGEFHEIWGFFNGYT
jgi:hypothetical protein